MARRKRTGLSDDGVRRITERLQELNLKQSDLAERIGQDKGTVSRILTQAQEPSLTTTVMMLTTLGMDINRFLRAEVNNEDVDRRERLGRALDRLKKLDKGEVRELLARLGDEATDVTCDMVEAALDPFDDFLSREERLSDPAFAARDSINAWLEEWIKVVCKTTGTIEQGIALRVLSCAFDGMRDDLLKGDGAQMYAPVYGPFESYPNALESSVKELLERSDGKTVVLQGVTVLLPSGWFNSPLGFRTHDLPYFAGAQSRSMDRYVELVESLCRRSNGDLRFRRLVVHDEAEGHRWLSDLTESENTVNEQFDLCFVVPANQTRSSDSSPLQILPLGKLDYEEAWDWLYKHSRKSLVYGEDKASGKEKLLPREPSGRSHLIVKRPTTEVDSNTPWSFVGVVDEYVRRLHTSDQSHPEECGAKYLKLTEDLQSSSGLTLKKYLALYDAPMLDLLAFGLAEEEGKVDWRFVLTAGFDIDNGVARFQTVTYGREIERIGNFWYGLHNHKEAKPWKN